MQEYEENPVLYDAIQRKQSVEESLQELAQVNNGIRKILPWRKNKGHNERIKQLGELVSEPDHLHTNGIFVPDNLITTGTEVIATVFGVSYLVSRGLLTSNPEVSPEEFQQTTYIWQVAMPIFVSVLLAPAYGLLTNKRRFFESLPTDEAKYLDAKVQEFYK